LSRHRHRFEAYLDKVFGFSDLVSALPEGRQFPQHAWKKVFDAVFVGAQLNILGTHYQTASHNAYAWLAVAR
jgi:hypothetical protein